MFKKIASNTISQIFSKVATAIISIFLISMLTNYLPVDKYGLYSKIYNYSSIFVFLADLGLYTITIREITNNKSNTKKIIWNVMSLRLILGIFILFFSVFLAFFLPGYDSPLALISIFISWVFTIFQLINSSILSLMQANMRIEFSAFSLIFWKLVNLALIWFIAFIFYPKEFIENSSYFTPFIYIMISWVIWVIINTILNYLYARKIDKFWFSFDLDYIKHLFKISLPYGIALFLSVVYFKVDIMLLSLLEWPWKGDTSIALYSLPMKIVEVIMVLGWFYMTSVLPSLSAWFKENNKILVDKIISISFKVLFSFSLLIFSLWVLFRDYLILIIANKDYLNPSYIYNSSDAFLVVFIVVIFYFLSLVFIYSLVASEKQSRLLKINIVVTIVNIVWNLILIPKYSFMWAGVVTIISQILLFIMGYFATKDIIKFKLPFLFIIRNIFFMVFIFLLWFFLLQNFNFWIYIDFLLYWFILFSIYILYFYFEFKSYFFPKK